MFLLICSFTITIFKALLESRIECFRFHPLSVADNLSDMKWKSQVEEYRVVGQDARATRSTVRQTGLSATETSKQL